MYKSGICDTNEKKKSGLQSKLLHGVYRNLCVAYRLVANLVTYSEVWPTSPGAIFFTTDPTLFVEAQQNLAALGVWPTEQVSGAGAAEFPLVAQTYFCDSRSPLRSCCSQFFHTRSPLRSPDFWPAPLPFRSNVSSSKPKVDRIFIQRNV